MKIINTIKTMSLAAILSVSTFASADTFYAATKTFEAMPETIRIPVSENGTINLRECNACDFHSVRVTPGTRYRINSETMSLEQFRLAIQQLKLDREFAINVRRDEESRTASIVFVTIN